MCQYRSGASFRILNCDTCPSDVAVSEEEPSVNGIALLVPVMWLLVRKSQPEELCYLSSTMRLLPKREPSANGIAILVPVMWLDVAATEAEPSASGIVLIVLSNVAGTEAERSVNGIESDGGSRANCLNRRDVWLRHQRQLTTIEPFRYTQKPFIVGCSLFLNCAPEHLYCCVVTDLLLRIPCEDCYSTSTPCFGQVCITDCSDLSYNTAFRLQKAWGWCKGTTIY
ncbi:hypothetical protein J6590_094922 [Homalodisca vitripennis]|nr:hypothetical protein J6590_094922 [Homalodisca vitripennis]